MGSLLTGTLTASDVPPTPPYAYASTLRATTTPGGASASENVIFQVLPANEIVSSQRVRTSRLIAALSITNMRATAPRRSRATFSNKNVVFRLIWTVEPPSTQRNDEPSSLFQRVEGIGKPNIDRDSSHISKHATTLSRRLDDPNIPQNRIRAGVITKPTSRFPAAADIRPFSSGWSVSLASFRCIQRSAFQGLPPDIRDQRKDRGIHAARGILSIVLFRRCLTGSESTNTPGTAATGGLPTRIG